jgi:hypothetical protein
VRFVGQLKVKTNGEDWPGREVCLLDNLVQGDEIVARSDLTVEVHAAIRPAGHLHVRESQIPRQ